MQVGGQEGREAMEKGEVDASERIGEKTGERRGGFLSDAWQGMVGSRRRVRNPWRMRTIRSVPRCGFPDTRISGGAPKSTNAWSTVRTAPELRPILVVSFPSDQVPAPPSLHIAGQQFRWV